MYNIKFIGTPVTVPVIIEPSEAQWESFYFTEAYCNGFDPFFEFEGFFLSIEHDCFRVDPMSRLYQSVVEFGGLPPTHWMVLKEKLFGIYQHNLETITILEFKEQY